MYRNPVFSVVAFSFQQPQLVQLSASTLSRNHSNCWRGVSLYKSVTDAACRLVENLSVERYTEKYPDPSLNGRKKSPQTGYFCARDEHPHLCCLLMREHEKEPRGNGCRGRWRAGRTALLRTWPEATAGRTQTPAGRQDPSTIATRHSWRTDCGNLKGRNKPNYNIVAWETEKSSLPRAAVKSAAVETQ